MGYGDDPAVAVRTANDSADADRSVPNDRTYDGAGDEGDKGDGALSDGGLVVPGRERRVERCGE